jgi:hypothetical protein
VARLVSRAEFARIAGVSGAAITKACKGPLAKAGVGKRLDLDHAAALAYLASKDAAPPAAPSKSTKRAPKPTTARPRGEPKAPAREASHTPRRDRRQASTEAEGSPEDLEDLAEALRPLLERFGTETRFRDWLDGLKKIEEIREKRLKNEETEAAVVRREPVKVLVFGAIDATHRRLLSDAPRTIVRRVFAMAKSGTPAEEAEGVVRELLGSILRPVKATAARVLRNA